MSMITLSHVNKTAVKHEYHRDRLAFRIIMIDGFHSGRVTRNNHGPRGSYYEIEDILGKDPNPTASHNNRIWSDAMYLWRRREWPSDDPYIPKLNDRLIHRIGQLHEAGHLKRGDVQRAEYDAAIAARNRQVEIEKEVAREKAVARKDEVLSLACKAIDRGPLASLESVKAAVLKAYELGVEDGKGGM